MAQQPEPWHESEHDQHNEVDGTRDPISASDVLGKGLTLESNCKPELCADRKGQRKQPDYPRPAPQMHFGEASQYVTRCKEDYDRHDGHFREFRPALSDAWDEERNAHDAEHETSAKHDCEVHEPGANGLSNNVPASKAPGGRA